MLTAQGAHLLRARLLGRLHQLLRAVLADHQQQGQRQVGGGLGPPEGRGAVDEGEQPRQASALQGGGEEIPGGKVRNVPQGGMHKYVRA